MVKISFNFNKKPSIFSLVFPSKKRSYIIPLGIMTTTVIYIITPNDNYYKDNFKYTISGINRSIQCLSTTLFITADYYFLTQPSRVDSLSTQTITNEQHTRNAKRLLSLFKRLGGVFIKLGQHLSSLEYIIPKEYCLIMSELHSSAPQSSFEDVLKTVKEELNDEYYSLIKRINPIPLGSASLAQVHHALLVDDTQVALKVQHRKVSRFMSLDLKIVRIASNIIHRLFPLFKLQWLVDEMSRNLPEEVNFIIEAENAMKTLTNFIPFPRIIIPKPIIISKRVLGMQYINSGIKVDDKESIMREGISPSQVCSLVIDSWAKMIFTFGHMHCDPHPGNILVIPHNDSIINGKFSLAILDHGLYRNIDIPLQRSFGDLWISILFSSRKEVEMSVKEIIKLSSHNDDGELLSMVEEKSRILATILTQKPKTIGKNLFFPLNDSSLPQMTFSLLSSLSHLLDQLPRPLIMILKTNDLLMHLERRLSSPNKIFFIYGSYSLYNAIWKYGDYYYYIAEFNNDHNIGSFINHSFNVAKNIERMIKLSLLSLLASIQQHFLQKISFYRFFVDHFIQRFDGSM